MSWWLLRLVHHFNNKLIKLKGFTSMLSSKIKTIVVSASIVFLHGCGGGGGGGSTGPVTSTLSFPLQTTHNSLIANGATKSFTVSGSCTGTGNRTAVPATTPAIFEGNAAALSAVSTLTATLTSSPGFVCAPTLAQTSTGYFDSNYVPLGSNSIGVNYGVYLIPPTIPTSVTVGGTGIIGTETLYTDSTKAIPDGRIDESYVIEADTANTAIVNSIGKFYDAAGTLIGTEQGRFRIAATGALVPVSTDLLYTSGIHLVFTYY